MGNHGSVRISRYALGWVVTTALVTLAAWWVVAAASGQVNDQPIAPVVSSADLTSTSIAGSTSSESATSTVDQQSSTTNDATNSFSSTTVPDVSSTSTGTGSAPPTTVPSSSTTTTVVAGPTSGVKSISSSGGTVTVSYGAGQVKLVAASPAIGYTMEVKENGPDKVRVDFDSDDREISVRAEWKDGRLVTEIEG